jgi:uncharacterized protein
MTGVAIFARAPVPGACKTRLIPALGADAAARLHESLVGHALAVALASGVGKVRLWCAPDAGHPFFAQCASAHGVALAAQSDGDLGARMLAAFEAADGPLLLMGADCPSITERHLRACARALEGVDAVFLPAEDGGYGLVGARRPHPAIFSGIAWGTDRVMAQTRAALDREGLTWREPAVVWDVDWPADLARLARERPALAPAGFQLPNAAPAD